ncbi:MAG: HD domain-containing protein [Lentisphaeria bacterium]|jgi:uncharacterized protein
MPHHDLHHFYPRAEQLVRERLASLPGCHDWDHTERVLHNARLIAREEVADLVVVEFAALLHDIGRARELADEGRTCHARLGAELARELLAGIGIADEGFIGHVAACVFTHRYRRRGEERPATLEAKVIYDADKLDSIGAVGIGRAFHFAGRIGARLHNQEAEALHAASYSREDTAYREFLVKLRHLHERMLTPTGKRLAAARHRFMESFFQEFEREIREAR